MKKTKFKEGFENAVNAFFEDENSALEFIENQSVIQHEAETSFTVNNKNLLSILKQVFLFLPSAFLLFFASVALTGRLLFPIGEGVQIVSFLQLVLLLGLSLTTIFGLGDLRNPKHFSIPISIISIGAILGAIGTIFCDWFGFGHFLHNYVPYFFPLAFIVPVLVKDWIEKE